MIEYLYNKAKDDLMKLVEINEYIRQDVFAFISRPINKNLSAFLLANKNADNIIQEFSHSPSLKSIDKYLSFWIYDCCIASNDEVNTNSPIEMKLTLLQTCLLIGRDSSEFKPIIDFLQERNKTRDYYRYKPDDAIILTAVPIEFIAVIRRLDLILTVSERSDVQTILDPDISLKDKEIRNNMWVEGIVIKEDKWVKVRVILQNEYGSVDAASALFIHENYKYPNDLLLVGVAGQIDKEEKVKIGDLVISNGFYNAYKSKLVELNRGRSETRFINSISYEDTKVKSLSDDYDVNERFCWREWSPHNLIEKRPEVENPEKESESSSVFQGYFISGPSVVKQKAIKKKLRKTFEMALAVEMETTGCFKFLNSQIVKNKLIQLKVIKAICDWSDRTKEKRWQPFCANLATEFAADYLIAKYGKILIDN